MLKLHGLGFAALLVLVSACSKNAASPAHSEASAAAPAPKPGDSNNTDYISIRFECSPPPTPGPAGKSPLKTRLVTYEDFGLAQPARPVTTSIVRVAGPAEPGSVNLDEPQRKRLYDSAIAALAEPVTAPELPLPESENCTLQLFRSGMQVDTRVQLPTSSARLRPLLGELAQLLPAY